MKENVIPFPGDRESLAAREEEVFCLLNSQGKPVPFQWVTGIQYKGVPYAVLHPVEEEEDVVAIFRVDETGEETTFRDDYDPQLQEEVFDFFCAVWEREQARRDDPGEYLILFDGEGNSQPLVQVDEIPYRGERYAVLFTIDPNDHDAVILRRVEDELEEVEDDAVVQAVYRIFRQRNGDRFRFEDGGEG